jgi:hypothetical protein
MFRLAYGPASSVTGASMSPGSNTDAFHITLTPCGAFSPVVTSAGSRPCETAVALYRMNQATRLTSPGLPATIRPPGSAQSRQVSTKEASRYSPMTSHPAQLAVRRPGAGAGGADSPGSDCPCSLVTLLTAPKPRAPAKRYGLRAPNPATARRAPNPHRASGTEPRHRASGRGHRTAPPRVGPRAPNPAPGPHLRRPFPVHPAPRPPADDTLSSKDLTWK